MRPHFSLLFLAAAGCASTPGSPATATRDRIVATDDRTGSTVRAVNDVDATRVTLPATADQVFAAVASSYAFLKIPITHVDRTLGEQGNKKFVMSRTFDGQQVSHYLNCGSDPFGGPNANSNPVNVSIVTRARAQGGTGTLLETIITGVTYKGGGSTGPIYCATTGAMELHLAEMVASRLDKDQ
ncbi:MAG TPA: hypothetical protein VGC52_07355 [Gemmatimonadaceae bacterium]